MDSGSQFGPNFGLKGREEIGGGYAIEFQLENGFSSITGAAANSAAAFSRKAWIGVSGNFGALKAGLQHSPLYDMVACNLDAFCVVSMASGFNNFITITPRASNSIRYDSPSIYGLKAQAMVSLRDQTTKPTNGVASYYLAFEYNDGGPINTQGGYQSTGDPLGGQTVRAWFYGLSYGYNNIRVFGGYEHASSGPTLNRNNMSMSARWQATPADVFAIGYTYLKDMTNANSSADQFGAQYQHLLSKRTLVYVDGGWLRNRNKAKFTLNGAVVAGIPAGYPGAPIKGIQFGIEHRF
jgi:predicted porin